MATEKYISLGVVAQETGLSRALLKRYAAEGKIPAIKTETRQLFKLSAVERALDNLAAQTAETRSTEHDVGDKK